MTKINNYILSHWREYKEYGQQVFADELQAKAFLLFLEFNNLTLEEAKETPEKVNEIFNVIDQPETLREALEVFDYFTHYYETDKTADEIAREYFEDERNTDYYDELISDALNFKSDTYIFVYENMAFHIGLC